jgi:steroid delta-isomerase-like uncharacterized protein/uncharacterized protein (TIGR02246 family)
MTMAWNGVISGLAAASAMLPLPAPERPVRTNDRQVAALTEMMDAVNAGDAARYARVYAPDAVITIHGGDVLKGRIAIEEYERGLLREFPGARLVFHAVWQKGPLAVVHYAVTGRTPGGQSMGHEGLLFYRFQTSGLVEDERRYLDSLTPMAQLGALGPVPVRALPALPGRLQAVAAEGSPREARNADLVKATLSALDSGKEAAFLAGFAEEAALDDMTQARPVAGRANVKAWFDGWRSALPDARSQVTTLLGAGEHVLAETVVRGTLAGPLGRVSATGREVVLHRAVLARIEDGKIARLSLFMNGRELAQAAGQWPPARTSP